MLTPGELVGGRYRISHVLGAGGMGVIHNAIDTRTGSGVAVKVIHATSAHDAQARARFSREVASLTRVGSEHVAQALGADVLEDGTPYLVMELLDGRDLRRESRLRGPLPVGEAVTYLVQACRGVSAIHQSGIVHRDLKPHNLFITNLDGPRRIKILDFGIAKSLDADCLTTTNVAVGTPLYMAPELLRNPRELSPLTDVWSLGVILYEILAGFSPFSDAPAPAVLLAVLDDPAVPLTRVRPDIPERLDAVVQRALAKDAAHRWQSAELFADALLEFAASEPLVVSAEQRAVRASDRSVDPGQLRREFRAEVERVRQVPTVRPPGQAHLPSSPWAKPALTQLADGSAQGGLELVALARESVPIWDDRSSSAHSSFVVPARRAGPRPWRGRHTIAALAALAVAITALFALSRPEIDVGPPPSGAATLPTSAPPGVAPSEPATSTSVRVPIATANPSTAQTAAPVQAPRARTPKTTTARKPRPAPVRPRSPSTQSARPRPASPTPRKVHDDNPLHL